MRRLFVTLSFVAALGAGATGAAAPVLAQQLSEEAVAARMKAQKEALAPLARMDGEWRGTVWIADRTGKRTVLVQTERVGDMLDGTVKVIEGRGFEDGKLVFNAFAQVSYDPDKKTMTMRSYTRGMQGDFPIEATADGFVWTIPAGPNAVIRYTAVIKDGTWVEKGEYVPNGGQGMQFMEMNLKRVGDTRWPAEGGLGPK
jgi:hypothetical protein